MTATDLEVAVCEDRRGGPSQTATVRHRFATRGVMKHIPYRRFGESGSNQAALLATSKRPQTEAPTADRFRRCPRQESRALPRLDCLLNRVVPISR